MTAKTPSKFVTNQEFEEFINHPDTIRRRNFVLWQFRWCGFSSDEKRDLYLHSAWYTLQKWNPQKSSLIRTFQRNLRYQILDYLEIRKPKQQRLSEPENVLERPSYFDEIIANLEPKSQNVMRDIFIGGLAYREIGKKIGCSVDTIGVIYKKAISKLRKECITN